MLGDACVIALSSRVVCGWRERVKRRGVGEPSSPFSIICPLQHLAKMKLLTVLVPIVHLVVTMLASSSYAMPATPDAAVSTLRGTLSTGTNGGAVLLTASRAANVSSQLLHDDEYDAATLEEALQLLEESE